MLIEVEKSDKNRNTYAAELLDSCDVSALLL
jgi:hypothetical protein